MKKLFMLTISTFCILGLAGCTKGTTVARNHIDVIDSALENQICDVAEFLNDATFCVAKYATTSDDSESNIGSAVVYKKVINENNTYTYYLVTNRHVAETSDKFNLINADGDKVASTVLGLSDEYDIGVLTFTSYDEYNAVTFADIEDIRVGEYCIAMGTPLSIELLNTVTIGNVSGVRDLYIQHNADINSGNSGGPLVDLNGNLIGINTSKLSSNFLSVSIEGICYSIRIDKVKKAIDEIEKANKASITPILGISTLDVENIVFLKEYDSFEEYYDALLSEYAKLYKEYYNVTDEVALQGAKDYYSEEKDSYKNVYIDVHPYLSYIADGLKSGILIREINERSSAKKAGLQVGDIIIMANDKEVKNSKEFQQEFNKLKVGDKLIVKVNRNGEVKEIEIVL